MRRIATTKLLFTLGGVRAAMSTTASADSAPDIVTFGGQNIGHVIVDTNANHTTIDYAVKNNGGRSPGHRSPGFIVSLAMQPSRMESAHPEITAPEISKKIVVIRGHASSKN